MPGIPRPQNLDKIPRNCRNQSVNPLYLTCCHIVYLKVFLIQFRFQLVLCYRNTTFVITIPKSKTNERHPIPRTFVHTQLADRANTLTLGRDSEWPFRLKTRHFLGRHIQPAWICHQGVHSQAPELLEKEMVSREMCQMRWISFRPKSQRHPQSQSAWQEIWPNIRGQNQIWCQMLNHPPLFAVWGWGMHRKPAKDDWVILQKTKRRRPHMLSEPTVHRPSFLCPARTRAEPTLRVGHQKRNLPSLFRKHPQNQVSRMLRLPSRSDFHTRTRIRKSFIFHRRSHYMRPTEKVPPGSKWKFILARVQGHKFPSMQGYKRQWIWSNATAWIL